MSSARRNLKTACLVLVSIPAAGWSWSATEPGTAGVVAAAHGAHDEHVVLHVRISCPRDAILPRENFPLRISVTNTTDAPIAIPELGYRRPPLQISNPPEKSPLSLWGPNAQPGVGVISLILDPGASAAITVPLTFWNLALPVALSGVQSDIALQATGEDTLLVFRDGIWRPVGCRWESNIAQILIRSPTAHEQEALRGLEELSRTRDDPRLQHADVEYKLAYLKSLVEYTLEFGDTQYSDRVRGELVKRGAALLESCRDDPEVVDEVLPVFQEAVVACARIEGERAAVIDRFVFERLVGSASWDALLDTTAALLRTSSNERTVDDELAAFVRNAADIDALQEGLGLPEGRISDRLRSLVITCAERCVSWAGYRSMSFNAKVFQLLESQNRHDLAQRTVERTLEAASLEETLCPGFRMTYFSQADVQAATKVLQESDHREAGRVHP